MAVLTTKRCWRCKTEKDCSDFYRNRSRPDGLAHECKQCSHARRDEWRRENPEANRQIMRKAMRKHRWGSDYDEWVAERLLLQDGVCAICRGEFTDRGPFIDHDHRCCADKRSCGLCRRGLLCDPCNRGLGSFGDDPVRLRAAACYLEG